MTRLGPAMRSADRVVGVADDRLIGLPRGRALRVNLALACVFGAYFWIVYGAGDFVAAHAATRHHVALPFETHIPLVPWAAAIYLTVTPFLCVALLVFRTPERLLPLFATLCAEVTIAGIVFVAFPVELSFPPHEVAGLGGTLHRLAHQITLTYNCVPSLHVVLALTAAWAFATVGGWRWRVLVWSWAGAIAVSTLLIHAHHIADLAAGAVLTAFCVRYVPPRVQRWLETREKRTSALREADAPGRA